MNRNSTLTDDAGQLTTVEISRDKNTNKPVAAYIRVRDGKVVDTKELVGGVVFADYDADGLLGIELLAPCKNEFLAGMPSYESQVLSQFIDECHWPPEKIANCDTAPNVVSPERRDALRQLIGIWKTESPPTDEQVAEIIAKHRMEKYG